MNKSPESALEDETLTSQIEGQCNTLFTTAPLPFQPNKLKKLELEIARQIRRHRITIPILFLSGSQYLIGPVRCSCEMRGEDAMVKVSTAYMRFEDYVTKNHRTFERRLVSYMAANKQSLNWVIAQLVSGSQLRGSLPKRPGCGLSDGLSSRNGANQRSTSGTQGRPGDHQSFSQVNNTSPDDTSRTAPVNKQRMNAHSYQSSGTQRQEHPPRNADSRKLSPLRDSARQTSPHRRRKKEGFLKDFSYRRQESI